MSTVEELDLQIQQESAFQTLVSKNAQERIAVLEAQNDRIVREAHSEINCRLYACH